MKQKIERIRHTLELEDREIMLEKLYAFCDELDKLDKYQLCELLKGFFDLMQEVKEKMPDEIKTEILNYIFRIDYDAQVARDLAAIYLEIRSIDLKSSKQIEDFFNKHFTKERYDQWLQGTSRLSDEAVQIMIITLQNADQYRCQKQMEQLFGKFDGEALTDKLIEFSQTNKELQEKIAVCLCYNAFIDISKNSWLVDFKMKHQADIESYEKNMFPERYREKKLLYLADLIQQGKEEEARMRLAEEQAQAPALLEQLLNLMLKEDQLTQAVELIENTAIKFDAMKPIKKKIAEKIDENQQYTEKNITFIFENDFGDIISFNKLKQNNLKHYILKQYQQYNKNGAIEEAFKWLMTYDVACYKDVQRVNDWLAEFEVNNDRLKIYMSLKVYEMLTRELLELHISTEQIEEKIKYYMDELLSHHLEARFLDDKFLQSQLDAKCLRAMTRYIYTHSTSKEIIKNEWRVLEEAIRDQKLWEKQSELNEFIGRVVGNSDHVEWFKEIMKTGRFDGTAYGIITGSLLDLMVKETTKRGYIESQTQKAIQQIYEEIGTRLLEPLLSLERNVHNVSDEKQKVILQSSVKKLRSRLAGLGIGTVEDIENYGRIVSFDAEKHLFQKTGRDIRSGYVKVLGVKVNGKILQQSQLEAVDEEVENE